MAQDSPPPQREQGQMRRGLARQGGLGDTCKLHPSSWEAPSWAVPDQLLGLCPS